MADVRLTIAGRIYDVSTSDGQEDHLVSLAAVVDERARKIAGTTEARQLLFASLMLADDVHEARAGQPAANPALAAREAELEAALASAQDKIEALNQALRTAEAAKAQAEAAQAEAAEAAAAYAAAPAAPKASPVHRQALEQLAERIESLADKFEQLV